jgi:hypothetical protein
VAINLAALVQLTHETEYFWFVWLTPALLATYLLGRIGAERQSIEVVPEPARLIAPASAS